MIHISIIYMLLAVSLLLYAFWMCLLICSLVAASHQTTAILPMWTQLIGALPLLFLVITQTALHGAMTQMFYASTVNHARLDCSTTSRVTGRRWPLSTLYSLSSSLLCTPLGAVRSETIGRTMPIGIVSRLDYISM